MEGVEVEGDTAHMGSKDDEDMEPEQDKSLPLKGWRFSSTGQFTNISSQLGPETDLYNKKNSLKRFVISYGGKFNGFLNKNTNFMIVGSKPCRKTITKTRTYSADLISYATLEAIIKGTVEPDYAQFKTLPEIKEYSQADRGILRNTTLPTEETLKDTEETAAAKKIPPRLYVTPSFQQKELPRIRRRQRQQK